METTEHAGREALTDTTLMLPDRTSTGTSFRSSQFSKTIVCSHNPLVPQKSASDDETTTGEPK